MASSRQHVEVAQLEGSTKTRLFHHMTRTDRQDGPVRHGHSRDRCVESSREKIELGRKVNIVTDMNTTRIQSGKVHGEAKAVRHIAVGA